MRNIDKILEIEALTENLTKHFAKNNLLKIKVLYFISQYENLSVSMIIEKLGLKKSNFALMTKELESEELIVSKQGEIDKRCRMLFLTEKGKEVLSSYLANLNAFFFEQNPEVEKAIDTLSTYLNKKI
ncbi:MAG: MarR family transcriptional regulator [Clostridiales bacterium]|nr:MarR family transcriptional regulator [Clostridiales bacterium]